MNGELGRTSNEEVMACFKVQSLQCLKGQKKNVETHSG
jgi:hypothetical protein